MLGVGDIAYDPDESIRAASRTVSQKKYKSHETYLKELQSEKAVRTRITVDDLDVLMLRNVPSDDYLQATVGCDRGRGIRPGGDAARSDRGERSRTVWPRRRAKMYFQLFPRRSPPAHADHARPRRDQGLRQGRKAASCSSRCRDRAAPASSWCSKSDIPNLNQMIDAVSRDGFVIAQEYLPAAEAGRHAIVRDERPAAAGEGKVRRLPPRPQRRRHAEQHPRRRQTGRGAKSTEEALKIAEIVRPKLVQDGMFLVGLDIVGDKLMEINVFSPGGLGSAQKFTKINFNRYVIDALERKVDYMQYYGRNFDNVDMCTL